MSTSIDIDEVLKIVQAASRIDYHDAMAALASKDPMRILGVVEQVTGILADRGVPYANDAKLVEIVLGLMIRGYQDGRIQSAEPTDPGMARAAGNTGEGTPSMHQPIKMAPGGTDTDPYGFDRRPVGPA